MAFWDFLGDKSKTQLPPGKKTPYYGDLAKTDIITGLLKTPTDQRDNNWRKQFLSNVSDAAFRSVDPQVVKGPDGFPYFILFLPSQYQPFEAFVIRKMKDDFLLDAGYGVIINPKGSEAEWVFSYGDILNFHLNGEYYSPIVIPAEQKEIILNQGEEIIAGQPSENFLPRPARVIIKDFLRSVGIERPKILLLTRIVNGQPQQELSFNVYPESFPSPKYFEFTMSHLPWFLPRHYRIVSFPKGNQFENSFADL
jgi:hypothetical protein